MCDPRRSRPSAGRRSSASTACAAGRGRGAGQAGVFQPDRQLQGPHGPGDDRGRRAARRAAARPARGGVHRRQHRLLAGLRLRGQGLSAHAGLLRCVLAGEAAHDARFRRRPDHRAQRGGKVTPDLFDRMREVARGSWRGDGAFWTDQFNNTDALDGYAVIGDELLAQTGGQDRRILRGSGWPACWSAWSRALRAMPAATPGSSRSSPPARRVLTTGAGGAAPRRGHGAGIDPAAADPGQLRRGAGGR